MRERTLGAKHNLSLSNRVWGELKLRAFQEDMTISELIAYILERFLTDPPKKMVMSRYQQRDEVEGRRVGRTIYIPDDVWLPAQKAAREGGFSVTMLVDLLAKEYLGIQLLERDEEAPPVPVKEKTLREETSPYEEDPDHPRYIQVGDKRIDLGENPFSLDLKTGELSRRKKSR